MGWDCKGIAFWERSCFCCSCDLRATSNANKRNNHLVSKLQRKCVPVFVVYLRRYFSSCGHGHSLQQLTLSPNVAIPCELFLFSTKPWLEELVLQVEHETLSLRTSNDVILFRFCHIRFSICINGTQPEILPGECNFVLWDYIGLEHPGTMFGHDVLPRACVSSTDGG